VKVGRTAVIVAVVAMATVLGALPAGAVPTLQATATQVASAISRDPSIVTGAAYVPRASANATAVYDSGLTVFPSHGPTFGVLSSGDAANVDDPGAFASTTNGGGNVRGNTDLDVTILRADLSVPPGRNCLSFDFQFLSEEYPNFVGSSVNDAFVAELDTSTWTTDDSDIIAPNNFAFGPDGQVISINSTGVAGMSAANGTGTSFDGGPSEGGATQLLRASTPITPGAHSLYLSIFDQGDTIYDSAVFLDNLSLGATGPGGCQPGASLPPPTVSKAADAPTTPAGGANGYRITVTNPNDVPVSLDTITDTLPSGFAYTPGSTSGAVTSEPVIAGQTLTWIEDPLVQVPADASISLHFAVTVAGEPGEYLNDAGATANGFAIEMTGPTAPITVTTTEPPPPPAQPCDPVSLEGTGAGETLVGTAGADRIRGLAGRDRIDALGDADELCGGLGGDYVYGRDGTDTLRGEEGNDRLYGGRDGDTLEGGPGHDAMLGGRGPDTFLAADGNADCIVGGRGDDSVTADPFDVVDPKKGCPPGFWL
jgi:uncharacterized repeat protein (TIGR01451 family)